MPNKSFLLLGPRGTGKSTWIKSALAPAVSIDLLEQREYLDYSAHPSKLLDVCKKLGRGDWVVIDEIQKIPSLLDEVHSLYESKKIHFALTGSSERKLRREGANLLAGRALQRTLFPLVRKEYGSAWSLDQALSLGTLPLIVSDPRNAEETLYSYVHTYLKEELFAEGLIRKLEPFSRFLKTAAGLNAQTLNVENIARESAVKRVTVDQYLEVLTDTLLAFRLEAFRPGHRARETAHPKLYFFDAGVARVSAQIGAEDFDSVLAGFAFETVILNELRAHLSYRLKHFPIFHYAVSGGYDIDLVVETRPKSMSKPRRVVLIELKHAKRIDPRWAEPLLDLERSEKLEIAGKFVVYRGKEEKLVHGVEVLPVDVFLDRLANDRVV